MAGVRRSGRIPREIPILLLGTDTSGRVFSEETHTLVLSLHGAGILSHNKLSPDEVLVLRLLDSGHEVEIRFVGNLGEDPSGGYVYGVTFCDPNLDFWQIEFPPPQQSLPSAGTSLQCSICGSRATVEQSEVEADVFLVSQSVFRYCDSCGQTTPWKLATGDARPVRIAGPVGPPPLGFKSFSSSNLAPATAFVPAPSVAPALVSAAPERSAYSGGALHELVSAGVVPAASVESSTAVALKTAPPKSVPATPPAFSGGGKPNRRRHVRTRVQFTACIRVEHAEEIVECDNVSKGGLCFRSRKHYSENDAIQIAVPYSPGQPAIFVPAQIRRVEEIPALALFRYGLAYT